MSCRLRVIVVVAVALFCRLPGRAQTSSPAPALVELVVDFGVDYFGTTPQGTGGVTDTPERRLVDRVKEFWALPADVESEKGHVVATLSMDEHGVVSDVSIVQPSPIAAFNTAVSNALAHLNPTPLRPEDCPPRRVQLTATFFYNEASTPGGVAPPAGWPPPGALRPGGDVVLPHVVREVRPLYTRLAMKAVRQGVVLIEAVVSKDGTVGDAVIVRSVDQTFGLDREALRAVKQWTFTPGTRLGEPTDVLVTVELTFTLR